MQFKKDDRSFLEKFSEISQWALDDTIIIRQKWCNRVLGYYKGLTETSLVYEYLDEYREMPFEKIKWVKNRSLEQRKLRSRIITY